MAKSLNNGQKELQNVESPQDNGNSNFEQLELPNMPQPNVSKDTIIAKEVIWNGTKTIVFETNTENPEVYQLVQKLWPIFSKLRKMKVNVNIKTIM